MYTDGAMCGWRDTARSFFSDIKSEITQSPQIRKQVKQQLKQQNAGQEIGKKLGCGIAKAFEDGVPRAFWGPHPKYGVCGVELKGMSGLGNVSSFVEDVTGPALDEARRVAARIAKPRIEARLKPWFIGLPIAGILVGAGVTYLVMKRRR